MAAESSEGFPRPKVARFFQSELIGVGHKFLRAIVSSDGLIFPVLPAEPPRFDPEVLAVGVGREGEAEPPLAAMRSPNVGSGQSRPPEIIAEAGKGRGDDVKSTGSNRRDVLEEDERRPVLGDEPPKLPVKTGTASRQARAAAGTADVLTGEAAEDDVDGLGQVLMPESSDVVPNRCSVKGPVGHA